VDPGFKSRKVSHHLLDFHAMFQEPGMIYEYRACLTTKLRRCPTQPQNSKDAMLSS